MATMRPSPRNAGTGSARQNREDPKPPPAKRGKRLSSSAKRDIAWAMKQQPGENTGSIIVHGVKILYTSPMVSTGGASKTSAPGGQTNATAETPLNSRQRRSKKRAEEHFKNFPQGKSNTSASEDGPEVPARTAAPEAPAATSQQARTAEAAPRAQDAQREGDVAMDDAPNGGADGKGSSSETRRRSGGFQRGGGRGRGGSK